MGFCEKKVCTDFRFFKNFTKTDMDSEQQKQQQQQQQR